MLDAFEHDIGSNNVFLALINSFRRVVDIVVENDSRAPFRQKIDHFIFIIKLGYSALEIIV
jgi:hypothetical protein